MDQEQNTEQIEYNLSFLKRPKWILIYSSLFIIIVLSNFNLGTKIDKLIYKSLRISSSCKLQMSDYHLNIFPLPHVQVVNLNVPGRCLGPGKSSIFFKDVRAYFRGPSFSPLGVLFKLETKLDKIPIEVFFSAGLSSFSVVLKESLIPLDKLQKFLPAVKLAGQVKTDLYLEFTQRKIEKLNLNLQSNTFVIPEQNIEGYKIETLNIQDMQLIATTDSKSNLKITKFVLGNEASPVRSSFQGVIKLSMSNPMASGINLSGELALSEELNDSIGFFFTQFDKQDNFYQIQLSGTLGRPSLGSKR